MAGERIRKNATVEIRMIKMTEKDFEKSILIFLSTFWIMSEVENVRKFQRYYRCSGFRNNFRN